MTAPGLSSCLAVPGWQSTKYSPISDCGRDSQKTSVRSEPKPSLSILKPTSACLVRLSSLMSVILPARTPATLRSPPLMRPNALSNSTQYLPLSWLLPAPVERRRLLEPVGLGDGVEQRLERAVERREEVDVGRRPAGAAEGVVQAGV